MKIRYYSIMRPVTPGSYPVESAVYIENYSQPNFFHEINGTAWGFIDYDRELTEQEAVQYELIARAWWPVTVASKKRGGGLKAVVGKPEYTPERPADKRWDNKTQLFKSRYYPSWQEAERVKGVLDAIEITTERVRMSVTQGEVKVFVNGEHITTFGDRIELIPQGGESFGECYGDCRRSWASVKPDSDFVLGIIWNPNENINRFSETICEKLGIEPGEWI